MTYTTTQLITNAWFISGIVARQLETVDGDQIEAGLDLLNGLLAMKSADLSYIPYWSVYDFNLIAATQQYYIPGLIASESFTFNIGTVRYSTSPQSRKDFYATGRVDGITSLPFNWYANRTLGGTNIELYFLPQTNYPAEIVGKFSLSNVTLGQNLELTLDDFYIQYLLYELSAYMCSSYNIQFQPGQAAILERYRGIVKQISAPDLTVRKISSFRKNTGMSWADINLGQGWRPS